MSTDTPTPLITRDPDAFRVPSGRELRELRLVCRLSIRESADRAGVSQKSIQRWEAGERSPRVCDLEQLLDVYRNAANGQQQFRR